MNANEFLGFMVTTIATLLGMASIIVAIIIKPIINLNKSITKLNDNIDTLNKSYGTLNERVTKHSIELDEHEKRILKIEYKEEAKK